MSIVALLTYAFAIRRILDHLELDTSKWNTAARACVSPSTARAGRADGAGVTPTVLDRPLSGEALPEVSA